MNDYGVRPEDITWVIGRPVRTIKPPDGIQCEFMPPDTTLEAMLERGEIDALASVMIPENARHNRAAAVRDPRKVEREYYESTRIFPIMHTLRAEERAFTTKTPGWR